MFVVDSLILVGSILLLLGIASSKLSSRSGIPVLVLFIGLGMLAGSEGLGGIAFEDYALSHAFGTLALALILFDGGLQTTLRGRRTPWAASISLATVGVLVTTAITGAAAAYVLGLSLLEGLLLGSIVGSTDAAAVFSLLRSSGINVGDRLASTIEIESGSNDPMAVFLTIGLIEVLLGRMDLGLGLLRLFVVQMSVGAAVGLAVGWAAIALLNRIDLQAVGLYPVLSSAAGLLTFGLAAALHGSGFLAIYVAGMLIGNRPVVQRRAILLFHEGAAWLAQIGMFVLLGLLCFPSRLLEVAGEGLLIAAVLILVARPLSVAVVLLPFRFNLREIAFISWGGLKGAVPIILATYPLLFGLPDAKLQFDVVFFVVLVSVMAQGWSLPWLARALGLQQPAESESPISLEIAALRQVDGEIVDYSVGPDSRAAGHEIRGLALPDGAVVAMIARGQHIIPPRGGTRVEQGDHVFLVLQTKVRPLVDRIFSRGKPLDRRSAVPEFRLNGNTTVASLEDFYGLRVDEDGSKTLDQILRERLPAPLVPGGSISIRELTLCVREISGGRVEQVGLSIRA